MPSINLPNGTPLGHAGSHPRHCTHVSMNRTKSSSIAASRHCTERIASIRPRGESPSSPVARYVGQCGKHSPQLTHCANSASSSRSGDEVLTTDCDIAPHRIDRLTV